MEKVSKHATALGVSEMVNTDQCWGYYYRSTRNAVKAYEVC